MTGRLRLMPMSVPDRRLAIEAKAFQNMDDPDNPIAIGTAPSKETFIAFFTKPEMQEIQKQSGVLGPPNITFLEEA